MIQPNPMRQRRHGCVAIVIVLLLVASACSTGSSETSSSEVATSETGPASTKADAPTGGTEAPTTTADESTPEDWPGEETELFARADSTMSVIKVEADDVLNIRSGPGPKFDIMATLAPDGAATATGKAWIVSDTFWYEVTADETTGWVASSFVAYLGKTDDATAEVDPDGEGIAAETLLDLGLKIAKTQSNEETPPTITTIDGPTLNGTSGDITVDLIGLGDDALLGYRLTISATEDPSGESFTMDSVERTLICLRGLVDQICA